MRRCVTHAITVVLALGCLSVPTQAGELIPEGSGSFMFERTTLTRKRPIKVFFYKPNSVSSTSRVLFAMHGNGRNAKGMRNVWARHADKLGLLVLAPEFSKEHYPSSKNYHLGNIVDAKGKHIASKHWAYTAIDDIFDFVRKSEKLTAKTYTMFGHSAGGQFTHRFVWFSKTKKLDLAIAANAGWYTFPDLEIGFPFGLRGVPDADCVLARGLQRPLIVLLGELDNDPKAKQLAQTKGARAQGPHRFARGQAFFADAKARSDSFAWRMQFVPECGHSSSRTAAAAAKILEREWAGE